MRSPGLWRLMVTLLRFYKNIIFTDYHYWLPFLRSHYTKRVSSQHRDTIQKHVPYSCNAYNYPSYTLLVIPHLAKPQLNDREFRFLRHLLTWLHDSTYQTIFLHVSASPFFCFVSILYVSINRVVQKLCIFSHNL